ncbi:universal stress protein [Aquihabitans sp. G128]|uniref:universal stress protein n=1 Tax=Aquihabitans sp. G128 TaxID=2849779 RepID=UPI001C250B57|nr:universal stress protein [Aquihabitans sp. G128]QXC62588.1 universal stress protein [Aquihabitans sp. G128]
MANDPTLPTSLDQLDPAVRAVVEQASTILVPVDDGTDDAYGRARDVAVELAKLGDAKLVLLDRVDTTYADTPRVFELTRDEVAAIDRPYLLDQLDSAAEAGVSVTAFQHSLPGDEALTDAVNQVGADAVVVPSSLDAPGFLTRLKHESAEERAVDAAPDGIPVLAVGDDGTVSVSPPRGQ